MDREFSDQGIVLAVREFRHSDAIVTFLSPRYGIKRCFAFGGKKSRRRFPGCLEELNHVIFKVASPRSRNYLYLQEGILLDRFANIHLLPSVLGMARNCQKFIESVLFHQSSPGAFEIFLNLLKVLNSYSPTNSPHLPLFFRARIAREMGWFPEIDSCNGCGRLLKAEAYVRFYPTSGHLYCGRCGEKGEVTLLSPRVYHALCEIFTAFPERWLGWGISPEEENLLAGALDIFIKTCLKVIWDRGRFVHI